MSKLATMSHNSKISASQSGAVLLISLVMLLLLTLIGVTGMQVASLEERMAGNAKDINLAFQAAETTLRGVEKRLASNEALLFNNTNGLYAFEQGVERWEVVDWSNSKTETMPYPIENGGLSARPQPRYIIEEIDSKSSSPEAGIETDTFYRVTTKGYGPKDNSVVVLQVVFKR
jgi:type IV pilus assembly protein PilX